MSDEDAQAIRETEATHAAVRDADDIYSVVVFGVRTPTDHRVVAVARDLYSLMQPAPELGDDLAAIVERSTPTPEDSWHWGPTYRSTVTVDGATHNVMIEPFLARGIPDLPAVLHYRIDLAPDELTTEIPTRVAVNQHWWSKLVSPGARKRLREAAQNPQLDDVTIRLIAATGYPFSVGTDDWPTGLREFILGQC